MTSLFNVLRQISWKKRISQCIGIFYGTLGLPFVILTVSFPFAVSIPRIFQSSYDLAMVLFLLILFVGGAFFLLSLGIGFWREKEWAYNIALFIHGLPILNIVLEWIFRTQGLRLGQTAHQPSNIGVTSAWNIFIIGFILIPRIYNYFHSKHKSPLESGLE